MAMHPTMNDTDESLMRLIRQGSRQAFAILVQRHTDRFFGAAYRMTGRVPEAEDLVQDAFLKIWHKPDAWKEDRGAKFTTWFYRILVNQNIDRMRRDKSIAPNGESVLPFVMDTRATPEHAAAQGEEERMLEAAISSLPERQKTALNLCFYEGLSNMEAAEAMGVKVKALESLLMRAKTGLKEFMMREHVTPQKGERYAAR